MQIKSDDDSNSANSVTEYRQGERALYASDLDIQNWSIICKTNTNGKNTNVKCLIWIFGFKKAIKIQIDAY